MPILAAHVIMTAYGFWLPNDPRGSWSDFVGAWELLRFGGRTKVNTRRSVAGVAHNVNLRRAAKEALKYEPVHFTGVQARAVGRGFARGVVEGGYAVHACSILADHVHLVLAPHERTFEQIVGHLKGRASQQLPEEGLHPFADFKSSEGKLPTVWTEGTWKVFCFDEGHVRNAIRYVRENPVRERKPLQKWSFVVPYGAVE